MRQKYRDHKFDADALKRIGLMNQIIDDYTAQGLRLTLRQLYYQLVTRNEIANTESSYKALGDLLVRGRMAGGIDWDAIEDRGREPYVPADWPDIATFLGQIVPSYRRPRWQGQTRYAELWVEKQALAGVLHPLASEFHVPLMVNKGYSSASAMHESAMRYIVRCSPNMETQCPNCDGSGSEVPKTDIEVEIGANACSTCQGVGMIKSEYREPWLFYLGDHDPSGEDMVRDIKHRMTEFGVTGIRVFKIALTMPQIERYNPPPNPAKITDSRAKKYIEKFGEHSWEVDALPPAVLAQIVRDAFGKIIDRDLMDGIIHKESEEKEALARIAKRWGA